MHIVLNIPAILLSLLSLFDVMSGDINKLLAAGCDGYIEGPIDPMRVIEQNRVILAEKS
ncbi:MAG: hypothetical protein OQK25_00990 [Gammaproteobacteria bacterium]|nr:hypothetical protein [Gammaproteobacteria bacterium]